MIECRECRHNPATHPHELCKACYFTPAIAKKYREEARIKRTSIVSVASSSAGDFVGDGCYTKKLTAIETDKTVVTVFGPMDVSKTNSLAVAAVHHSLADTVYSAKETFRSSAAAPNLAMTNKDRAWEPYVSQVRAMVSKDYRYNTLTIRQRHQFFPHKYPCPLPESHQIIGKAKQIAAEFITGKINQEKMSAIFSELSDNDWPLYCQLRMYADCIKACDIKRLKEVLECVILDRAEQSRIAVALAMSVYEEQPVPKWAGFSSQLQAALPSLVTAFNTYLYGKAHDANAAHYDLAEESCHWSIREPWLISGQVVPKSPVVDAAVKIARDEPTGEDPCFV